MEERKSVAYERLWEIAEVLGVDVIDLLLSPSSARVETSLLLPAEAKVICSKP